MNILYQWDFFKNLLSKHCLYKMFGETYTYLHEVEQTLFVLKGRLSAQREWFCDRKTRELHDYNLVWSEGDLLSKNVTLKASGTSGN